MPNHHAETQCTGQLQSTSQEPFLVACGPNDQYCWMLQASKKPIWLLSSQAGMAADQERNHRVGRVPDSSQVIPPTSPLR